jgi:sugar-specific transcriptional regulator TrmB
MQRSRHALTPQLVVSSLTLVEGDAIVRQLGRLGLTSYEAKAYVALLRRDSSTASEVARVAGLPRQRIYDVLGSLVERGLASARPGDVVKYGATAPELALGQLVQRQREELGELERQTADVIDRLTPQFEAGRVHTDPLEYIEVLRDREAINTRFGELQASIKDEILVFTKPPYATPPQENVEGLDVVRSHRARAVYEYSAFDDPAFTEGVRRFIEAGEEARFVTELPLKLVVIDETIVMFGMDDPIAGEGRATIVVVEHPQLASVLKIAFQAVFETGLTFDEAYEQLVVRKARSA